MPDSSHHLLHLVKLFNSTDDEGHFGTNKENEKEKEKEEVKVKVKVKERSKNACEKIQWKWIWKSATQK